MNGNVFMKYSMTVIKDGGKDNKTSIVTPAMNFEYYGLVQLPESDSFVDTKISVSRPSPEMIQQMPELADRCQVMRTSDVYLYLNDAMLAQIYPNDKAAFNFDTPAPVVEQALDNIKVFLITRGIIGYMTMIKDNFDFRVDMDKSRISVNDEGTSITLVRIVDENDEKLNETSTVDYSGMNLNTMVYNLTVNDINGTFIKFCEAIGLTAEDARNILMQRNEANFDDVMADATEDMMDDADEDDGDYDEELDEEIDKVAEEIEQIEAEEAAEAEESQGE